MVTATRPVLVKSLEAEGGPSGVNVYVRSTVREWLFKHPLYSVRQSPQASGLFKMAACKWSSGCHWKPARLYMLGFPR
jgi:hypothetical protein